MFDVLDMDSNNAHLATTYLDREAMSGVIVFGQPVSAPLSENPPDLVTIIGVVIGPNYFRLGETLTLCK